MGVLFFQLTMPKRKEESNENGTEKKQKSEDDIVWFYVYSQDESGLECFPAVEMDKAIEVAKRIKASQTKKVLLINNIYALGKERRRSLPNKENFPYF